MLRRKLAAAKVEIDSSFAKTYAVPFRQIRIGGVFYSGGLWWLKRTELTATLNGVDRLIDFELSAVVIARRMEDLKVKDPKGGSWDV